MRLREVILEAGVGGRRMPPFHFRGSLLSAVGSLAVLIRTPGWQAGWPARHCCAVCSMKEVPPQRGKGHFCFPVIFLKTNYLDGKQEGEIISVCARGSVRFKYR